MQIRSRLRLLRLLKGTTLIAEIVACDDSEGPANRNRNLLVYKGVVVSVIEPIRLNVSRGKQASRAIVLALSWHRLTARAQLPKVVPGDPRLGR